VINNKKLYYSHIVIQSLIAIAAIPAGLMLIIDPSGEMIGFPDDAVDKMPFDDFLIPGVILFVIIGLGNLIGGVLTYRNYEFAWFCGISLAVLLFIWLTTQAIIMENSVSSTVMQLSMGVHAGIELFLSYWIYLEWKTRT
jgi:hypothetical protein